MILPDTLKYLTTLSCRDLARCLDLSGYSGASFESAEFVGITNGGDFCYRVTYRDDGTVETSKVFVKYDAGTITAAY